MEPPVCDPMAAGKMRAATPAAEPLLEPPGVCAVFQALRVGEGSPLANWVVMALPIMTAPAWRNSATEWASWSGT